MRNAAVVAGMLVALSEPLVAGSLSGTVVDRSTGLPIAGALVTVHVLLPDSIAYPDTSNAGGEYFIDGIVTGNQIYVIMTGKPGYKPYYFRHDQIGSGSYLLDIVMEPDSVPPGGGGGGDSSDVTGQVLGRDRASGTLTPLPGAEVRLLSGSGERIIVTGAEGWFRSAVPRGNYAVTVSAPGFESGSSGGVVVGDEGLTFGTILVSSVTGISVEGGLPSRCELIGAYPNPFNPGTQIRFRIAEPVPVRLTVHNLLGQELVALVDARLPAGDHAAYFNATGRASGIYLFRLQAGKDVAITRAVLLR